MWCMNNPFFSFAPCSIFNVNIQDHNRVHARLITYAFAYIQLSLRIIWLFIYWYADMECISHRCDASIRNLLFRSQCQIYTYRISAYRISTCFSRPSTFSHVSQPRVYIFDVKIMLGVSILPNFKSCQMHLCVRLVKWTKCQTIRNNNVSHEKKNRNTKQLYHFLVEWTLRCMSVET